MSKFVIWIVDPDLSPYHVGATLLDIFGIDNDCVFYDHFYTK